LFANIQMLFPHLKDMGYHGPNHSLFGTGAELIDLNLPLRHVRQGVGVGKLVAYWPARQYTQTEDEDDGAYAPWAQTVHTEATSPEKVPLGQRVQEVDPSMGEYVPARQLVQSPSDKINEAVVYFPGTQVVHLEAPAAVVNFPISHDIHTEDKVAETVAEYFPTSQDIQTVDAAADE
jgi:hypothetical protein